MSPLLSNQLCLTLKFPFSVSLCWRSHLLWLLLEVSTSKVFGDFHVADSNFCRDEDDKFLVQRKVNGGKEFQSQVSPVTAQLLQERHSLNTV